MDSTVGIFIVAAVVLNAIIYGGVAAVFFADERRPDPTASTPAGLHGQPPPALDAVRREAREAA